MFKIDTDSKFKENQIKRQEFINSVYQWGKEAAPFINNKEDIPEYLKNKFQDLIVFRVEQIEGDYKESYKQAILEAVEGVLCICELK
jgi:hypothetical protein